MRVYVLLDFASATASVTLKATSTSPMSRWFGLSTRWCEHRPVCAPLSRHRSNGTLGRRRTRRSDVYAASRDPCCCASVGHDGLRLSLDTCVRHLSWALPLLSGQVGCSVLRGAQSRPRVELFRNSLPNGSEVFTLRRSQTAKQDVARRCNGTFDVVSCMVSSRN